MFQIVSGSAGRLLLSRKKRLQFSGASTAIGAFTASQAATAAAAVRNQVRSRPARRHSRNSAPSRISTG